MRCVFVAKGWENISLQSLSAVLKQAGHETHLVYDQALFDDKNYLSIKWLAKIFDQEDLIIQRIIELKPDLLAFHVLTVQYREMRELAKKIKKIINVPIIFGGIHPHSAPEKVLLADDDSVDMICLGEGEYPLLELCNNIEKKIVNHNIDNIWFRLSDGTIIKNKMRPLILDINQLPIIDKELFAPHYPMKYSYLSCPSRGCSYTCTYCSLSFLSEEADRLKGARVRERTPQSLINELKTHMNLYDSEYIDFRQPIMSVSRKWIIDFFTLYKKEINRPFRCFMHPSLINLPVVKALRAADCYAIQIGIECFDEEIRNKVMDRHESNADIQKAINILEEVGQPYALDYILGAPRPPKILADGTTVPLSENEKIKSFNKELLEFAKFLIPLKYCYRIAPFMLQYMPGTKMVEHGLRGGDLTEEEVKRMNEGHHDNYMNEGSVFIDPKRLRLLQSYKAMFRLMSFLPPWAKALLFNFKLYKIFWMTPFRISITALDLLIAVRDKDARAYVKNYWWWIRKRFDKNYHLYIFRKKRNFSKVLLNTNTLPPEIQKISS